MTISYSKYAVPKLKTGKAFRETAAGPALGLAGLFAVGQPTPDSAGTIPTDSWSFAILRTFTALIVSALRYFPALALGPLLDHLPMVR